MTGLMIKTALVSLAGTAAFAAGYALTALGALLPLAITCGTVFYHFAMRLLVAWAYDAAMHDRADLRRRRYRVSAREAAFYEKLGAKRWKSKLPTADASLFDPRLHSWEEIAQAMCQAERIHAANALLSFLPIAAGTLFGAWPVFILTSLLSAAFDTLFVIEQRYNRYRVMRIIGKKNRQRQ